MQFDQYHLYGLCMGSNVVQQIDKVDSYIQEVRDMTFYEDLKSSLVSHFGEFSGIKWVEYPELKKDLYLLLEEDKIEICALKNDIQYFGRGWKLIAA